MSGARLKTLEAPFNALHRLAFSPDGAWIVAIGQYCNGVYLFEAASGARVLPDVFGEEMSNEVSVVVTPDRRRIALIQSIRARRKDLPADPARAIHQLGKGGSGVWRSGRISVRNGLAQ